MNVSDNMGANSAQQAVNYTVDVAKQLLDMLEAFLKRSRKKYKEASKGVKALADHMKKGGQTNILPIPEDKVALFESFLKAEHVPFVILKDHNNGQVLFQTRDTDSKVVERAFKRFDNLYTRSTQEFRLDEFLNMHRGEQMCEINRVSELELEMFRREAADKKNGLSFSVIHDEHNKKLFSIVVTGQDFKSATETLKGVHFDLNAPDVQGYTSKLNDAILLKNEIYDNHKKDPEKRQIILSKNPNRFITVEKGTLYVHSLSKKKVKGRNGQEFYEVTDDVKSKRPFGNMDLIEALTGLGEFKMGTNADIAYIQSFDKEGRAVCDGDAFHKYSENFKKQDFTDFNCSYSHLRVNEQHITRDKAVTLQRIEPFYMNQILAELESHNISHYARGSNIAFSAEDMKQVENVLDKTLYKDMSAREKFEARNFYEQRATNDYKVGKDHFIIHVPGSNSEIEFTSQHMIIHSGINKTKLDINNPEVDNVLKALGKNYCVLSPDEFVNGPERDNYVHRLMQLNKNDKLVDEYMNSYQIQKDDAIVNDTHLEEIVRQYEVRNFVVDKEGVEQETTRTYENQNHKEERRKKSQDKGPDL